MLGAAMTNGGDTRDIAIRVDTELRELRKDFDVMSHKVDELHALFQQARGARWAIIAMAAIGGFIASKIGAFIPWMSLPPR
jgi:signal transduction histidine kinase